MTWHPEVEASAGAASRGPLGIPALPAVVPGHVRHTRRTPFRHDVGFDGYLWLVDLDDLPRPTALASFESRDHFAPDDSRSIREKLLALAAAHGLEAQPGDRLVMLAGARSLGGSFNPLSVHWCFAPGGETRWAVLEVHNTYGERHPYVLQPDAQGRATVAKAFYVSPFFEVEGRYLVKLRVEPERIGVAIVLEQGGRPVFTATFAGRPEPATRRAVWRAALRTPFVMHQTTARIRAHGVWLWARRLPVIPRPSHPRTRGMS